MHTMELNITLREIITEINSEKYHWRGYANGDTDAAFQARKCIQVALVLIAASKVIEADEAEISKQEAMRLFYDHIRHLNANHVGDSANSCLRLDIIPNLYKAAVERTT